jgi:hypothetical protein
MDGKSENPRDRASAAFASSGKAFFFGSFLLGQREMNPAAQRTECS